MPAPAGVDPSQSPLYAPGWACRLAATRIKDIVSIGGVRPNQLVGYGLVIGLNGTGDSLRNAPFTEQSLQSMLDRMGVNIRKTQPRTRNVAAVIVTAELPAFIGRGSRIDITVSSLGDATSLVGGSLIMTPLAGPDNRIYAVAQGPVIVSGFSAGGAAETVTQNVPTSARVPNGALVERDPPSQFGDDKYLVLELRNPDFATAVRVADAINLYSNARYGVRPALERDLRTITLVKPKSVGAGPVHRRDRQSADPAGLARAGRGRRAHRDHRDRQRGADFDRRRRPWQPDRARDGKPAGLPAQSVRGR